MVWPRVFCSRSLGGVWIADPERGGVNLGWHASTYRRVPDRTTTEGPLAIRLHERDIGSTCKKLARVGTSDEKHG